MTPPAESKRRRTIFLHAGQYRAALPQQQSRSVVACRRRRRGREAVVKVLPRHTSGPRAIWLHRSSAEANVQEAATLEQCLCCAVSSVAAVLANQLPRVVSASSASSFISCAAFEERTGWHPEIYQSMAATSFLTVQARLARALVKLGKYVGQDDGAGARHDPPQDLAGRPCGNGRGGTRKCEPGDKQLEAEQGGFAVVGLLLSHRYHEAQTHYGFESRMLMMRISSA